MSTLNIHFHDEIRKLSKNILKDLFTCATEKINQGLKNHLSYMKEQSNQSL